MSYRSSTINISGGSPGSFTTLTVTGVASFAAGTAAAVSVKIGGEENGLYSPSAGVLGLAANGLLALTVEAAAASTNYWGIFASAAGTRPSLRAKSTTAVSANIQNGAAAPIVFSTDADGTAREALRLLHNTGANYLTIQNGTSPIIGTSAGDLLLSPGGGAVVSFGSHSALAAETVTGYITIKDAAGNSRKLAVIS